MVNIIIEGAYLFLLENLLSNKNDSTYMYNDSNCTLPKIIHPKPSPYKVKGFDPKRVKQNTWKLLVYFSSPLYCLLYISFNVSQLVSSSPVSRMWQYVSIVHIMSAVWYLSEYHAHPCLLGDISGSKTIPTDPLDVWHEIVAMKTIMQYNCIICTVFFVEKVHITRIVF